MDYQALQDKLQHGHTYEMTKVQVKNEDSRYFKNGDKTSGEATLWGKRLVIGDIMTSNVVNWSENGPHIVIETENSVYTLEDKGKQ